MYTVSNRMYTVRSVEGMYTEFYSCGRIPSMSGHMSVYYMYTGRIKGYTECGVYGMCTDFVYLKENDPWISLSCNEISFLDFLNCGRFYGYSNLSFELIRKQTSFTSVSLCCLFNIYK